MADLTSDLSYYNNQLNHRMNETLYKINNNFSKSEINKNVTEIKEIIKRIEKIGLKSIGEVPVTRIDFEIYVELRKKIKLGHKNTYNKLKKIFNKELKIEYNVSVRREDKISFFNQVSENERKYREKYLLKKESNKASSSKDFNYSQLSLRNPETFNAVSQGRLDLADAITATVQQEHFIASPLSSVDSQNICRQLSEHHAVRLQICAAADFSPELKTGFIRTKYFPLTKFWFVGGSAAQNPELHAAIIAQMSQFASEHFLVVTACPQLNKELSQNTLCVDHELRGPFVQDYLSFTDHEIRMGAFPANKSTKKLVREMDEAIIADRIGRGYPAEKKTFMAQAIRGQVIKSELFRNNIYIAAALGLPLSMNLTNVENGNIIFGEREGRACLIIGKDSVAANKKMLEDCLRNIKLNISLNEKDMKKIFAIDYGIHPDNIFFVEQAGDFHLDMQMAFLSDNTVIINDSEKAFELFAGSESDRINHDFDKEMTKNLSEEDLKRDDTIKRLNEDYVKYRAISQERAYYENKAANELSEHFIVKRFPGVFFGKVHPRYPFQQLMNFFNLVTARDLYGQKHIVALGCLNEKYKALFLDMLKEAGVDTDNVQIHFLDYAESTQCLILSGGISCLTASF